MISKEKRMKRITLTLLMTVIVAAAAVFELQDITFAYSGADSVPTEPQNGIPLVIIRIDESEEAIAAAEADTGDDYGTITEMNSSENHSVRCTGTVEVKVPAGYAGEYGSVTVPAGAVDLKYIRGRGNSTWDTYSEYAKNPYKIKFEKKQELFGMGKNKEWALLANANDETLLKNRIVSWLGERMGLKYTPQMIPVDVVMIGSVSGAEELGSYCLSELVGLGEGRVDIEGAKLLAIYNSVQKEAAAFFNTYSGVEIMYEDPDTKDDQVEAFVNDLDNRILDPETIDEAAHEAIAKRMDLTSAADYWWVQEFVNNNDAYNTSSTYMYLDPKSAAAGTDWKLIWGPLWDFDLTFNNTGEGEEAGTKFGFNNTGMIWLDRLRGDDPLFDDQLKQEWSKLEPLLAELTSEGGKLDQMESEIRSSWTRDREIWQDYYGSMDEEERDLDAEVEKTRSWIDGRRKWINDNLDQISRVYCTVTYSADGIVVGTEKVREGDSAMAEAEAPDKDGYFFLRWEDRESGADLDEINVTKDMIVDAVYISQEEAVKPKGLYFTRTDEWEDMNDKTSLGVYMKVFPEDAVVSKVMWTSSDESVAVVNNRGELELLSEGDATITATLYNGVTGSYALHVYDSDKVDPQLPAGIDIKQLDLKVGQTEQISYTILPEGGIYPDCVVMYDFEGSDCIEFDSDVGVVTALKPGKAVITVNLYANKDSVRFTEQCEVTVAEEAKNSGSAEAVNRIVPKGTKIKKLHKSKKAITVRWKKQKAKVDGAHITGYQIQIATNKKFTRNRKTISVKGYKTVSKKIKKLKRRKTYYVRVRTYIKADGSRYCSPWSKARSVRTR